MLGINPHRRSRFLVEISKLDFIFPIFFALLIAMILAQLALLSGSYGKISLLQLYGDSEAFIILNLFVIAIVSVVSLLIFFHVLKIRNELAVRILVAAFIMGGMLSSLLFGKLVFTLLGLRSHLLHILVAAVAYLGAYFAYLVIVDVISERTRNTLFVICSGILGAFLGVLIHMLAVIGISIALSVVDTILIKRGTAQRIIGLPAEYEKLIMKMTFSTEKWGIGIGDLICYSMIVSSSAVNFGVLAGCSSLGLILIGSFLTMILAVKRRRVPGLPVVTALGLLPSIMLLLLL
jgi:hypothetical protein